MLIFLTTLLASLASIFRRVLRSGSRTWLYASNRSAPQVCRKAPKFTAGDRQLWILSAPRSPWQRAYIERVIGSVRRECLDHMIVFHETSLRRNSYFLFRLLSPIENASFVGADAPEPRAIHPPEMDRRIGVAPLRTVDCTTAEGR